GVERQPRRHHRRGDAADRQDVREYGAVPVERHDSAGPELLPLMRRLHLIATLLVGVPLVVWTVTGFAFTWFDFAAVRGAGDRVEASPLAVGDVRVSLADAVARAGGTARTVELRDVGGRPAWIVDGKRINAI